MNNSINVSPSASAGVQQSKSVSSESANSLAYSEEDGGFTQALASIESEAVQAEQQLLERYTEMVSDITADEILTDGNSLPAEEQAAMWQAMLLQQPIETVTTNSTSPQLQSMDLLDSQRKPTMTLPQLKADYFTTITKQNKDVASAFPLNNGSIQLAAAQFIPEKSEGFIISMSEQLAPVQGVSSTLTQSLAAVGLGTATQAASTQTQMAPLNLGQNAWETNLGSRLQMMIGQNVQTAEIRLDPPELGSLDIKVKITNDVASVNITSAHAQVREALETAVPKLREMFAESGVELGDVNVRQESSSQQQNASDANEEQNFAHNSEIDSSNDPTVVTTKVQSNNLLDIYA